MDDKMQLQVVQLVLAAMQGDQLANQQIQQIMLAAQQGDLQATALAQMIQQVAQLMQGGQPQAAKHGAKLNYLKSLNNLCPEGYELGFFKAGGKVCSKCMKKAEKACGGAKVKLGKGGCTKTMNGIKSELSKK